MKKITEASCESLKLENGKVLKAEFGVRKSVFSTDVDNYYFDISNEVLSEEEEQWLFTPLTLEKKSSRAIPFLNYFNDKMKYGCLTQLDWCDLRDCINNTLSQPKLWDYIWSTVSQLKKVSGAISTLSINGPGAEIFAICDQEILAKCLVTLSDAFAFDDVNTIKKMFSWDSRWLKSKKNVDQFRITANKKINDNEEIFNELSHQIESAVEGEYYKFTKHDNNAIYFKAMSLCGEVCGRINDKEVFIRSDIKKDGTYRYDVKNIGWTYLRVRQ